MQEPAWGWTRRSGADVIFIEAPEGEEEFHRIGQEVDAPLLANMVPTGKSSMLPAQRLQAYGFRIAIYPVAGVTAACAALDAAYRHLLQHGSLLGATHASYDMAQLHELVGFPDVWAFERDHAET
jgi:2-methylisocitrate lyase-like PEP mutase family enzyme